ncbi:DUF3455 domain-containing protein [Burkholderia gladioli]|uniref:DUF3455 domain-containing protein n=1 Tax=Burkholderia gladioli TaxID=28095 RepID=UPI00163EB755|nr:DUF3455 domain-containing protein [Burkholderia gladioli]
MHVFPFVDRRGAHRASRADIPPASHAGRASLMLGLTLVLLAGCATRPPGPPDATVPDSLRGAHAEAWQETLMAVGDQVYRCRRVPAQATDTPGASAGDTLRWLPYGPEATLVDARGRSVGALTPGRYFLAHDGSFAVGKTEAATIVDASALPWVRYTIAASTRARGGRDGRMTRVSTVIRINTRGGLPASDSCRLEGTQLYVPYFATYLVYRPAAAAR